MEIKVTGTAIIVHNETGVSYEIESDLLDWNLVGGEESPMGARHQYQAKLEHDDLGSLEWTVWEYPANAMEGQSYSIGRHRFVQEFDITLEHEPKLEEPELIFSDDDLDGMPIDNLKNLNHDDQVSYLVHWFYEMFEDPQNETPYSRNENSSSNYEFIWGGPYDALEQLDSWFTNIASEKAIESAAKHVEARSDIYEWAPGPKHPDHQRAAAEQLEYLDHDETPSDLEEFQSRISPNVNLRAQSQSAIVMSNELGDEISQLRKELKNLSDHQKVGIGHNHPPDTIELDINITIRIESEMDRLDGETTKLEPDPKTAIKATSRLKSLANELRGFLGQCYEQTKSKAASAIAMGIVGTVTILVAAVLGKLDKIVELATNWLDYIVSAI